MQNIKHLHKALKAECKKWVDLPKGYKLAIETILYPTNKAQDTTHCSIEEDEEWPDKIHVEGIVDKIDTDNLSLDVKIYWLRYLPTLQLPIKAWTAGLRWNP